MSLQHFGKATLRVAKNYTKGYSDVQTKVRDATSNDPWGPTGQQMNELARLTYNQNDFVEIMEMLDKRLNDKGKNWRHVFKALTVLDYLLHNGSENVVVYFRDNVYIIKTLKEFQYVDEYSKDQGANVRQKAKDITNLLSDESRLREERKNRASMRDRMIRGTNGGIPNADGVDDENNMQAGPNPNRNGRRNLEDEELQRAIEASKLTAANEQTRSAEEADLERAIRLSEEEEAKRNKSLEEANSRALFDEQAQSASNNPFPLFDATGQVSSQFTQQQLQPQYTAVPAQFTSFNPYQQLQLQQQQEAMQANYAAQQQEWLRQQQEAQRLQQGQEEWNRQQHMLLMQQQQDQQQQQQQQQMQMQMQMQMQQFMPPAQPVVTQPTGFGSNNPFAPQVQSPSPLSSTANAPSHLENFSLPSTFSRSPAPQQLSARSSSASPGPPSASPRQTRTDVEHSHLANLLANRDDGQDTFGNVGLTRFGPTTAGRIMVQKTGYNPFAAQQQQAQQQSEQPFFSI